VYRTEDVARAVVACAKRPRAELDVGGSALLLDLLASVGRPISDLFLATYGIVGHAGTCPPSAPGCSGRPRVRGTRRGTVRGRPSVWTALRLAVHEALGRIALAAARHPGLGALGAHGGRGR
jgi:hypothetical protein